jgi:hypothetical protein
MGYRANEPGLTRAIFRGTAISLFTVLALAQCGIYALGETFNDPLGNAIKTGQVWGCIVGTVAGGVFAVRATHERGVRAIAAAIAAIVILTGSAIVGGRIAAILV